MARPKKDKALRHTHPVMLRFTDTEYELVSTHAKAAHLPLAEYSLRKNFRKTEQDFKSVNEQIHYTGQYLANKSLYKQYLGSKNKKKFRQGHQSEITLYETDRKVLKEHADGGKLPSMKALKTEKKSFWHRRTVSTKPTRSSAAMKKS